MRRTVSVLLLTVLVGCTSSSNPPQTYAPPTSSSPATATPDSPISTAAPTATPDGAGTPVAPPAVSSTVFTPPSIASPDGPDTFTAFAEMRTSNSGGVRPRWNQTILRVKFATTPTSDDLASFEYLTATLANLPGVPALSRSSSEANITVHYLPPSRWGELGMAPSGSESVNGYTKTTYQDGSLLSAVVVVDDALTQPLRNKTLVHELIHALGLGHHTCAGGMMYGGSNYDPSWFLSQFDTTLVEAWYSDSYERTLQALPCPPVQWDMVPPSSNTNGATLWCKKTSTECYEVSSRTGPLLEPQFRWYRTSAGISEYDPEKYVRIRSGEALFLCNRPTSELRYAGCESGGVRSVNRTDAWFDGNVIYKYDPDKYIPFRFEGRRLLCEKPSATVVHTPCQYTEGSTITAVDAYTDGSRIYKEKPQ